MAELDDPQVLRLINAATAAFQPFEKFGFRIVDPDGLGGRGASVMVRSHDVQISIAGNWYDRELYVSVQVAGAKWIPVAQLVPELEAAVRLLPRSARRSVLQKRLEMVATALQRKAPALLHGGEEALVLALKAGAEPVR